MLGPTTIQADEGVGLPAFSYYMPYWPRFWRQMKGVLASGVPLLMRLYPGMYYPMSRDDLHGVVDREGHVVMVTGYDDQTREVSIVDPWDARWGGARSGACRISYDTLMVCAVDSTLDWTEALVPWDVTVAVVPEPTEPSGSLHLVLASVMYTCPEPFSTEELAVAGLTVSLDLPAGLELADGERHVATISSLAPGKAVESTWHVRQTSAVEGKVVIHARGTITGQEPYAYRDVVGVRATAPIMLAAPVAQQTAAARSTKPLTV